MKFFVNIILSLIFFISLDAAEKSKMQKSKKELAATSVDIGIGVYPRGYYYSNPYYCGGWGYNSPYCYYYPYGGYYWGRPYYYNYGWGGRGYYRHGGGRSHGGHGRHH